MDPNNPLHDASVDNDPKEVSKTVSIDVTEDGSVNYNEYINVEVSQKLSENASNDVNEK